MAVAALTTFARQTKALVKKNLVLFVQRKWLSTFIQAHFLPILILTLCLNIKNFTKRGPGYGIGPSKPIGSLRDSLVASGKDFIIVSNDTLGPDVATVIDKIVGPLDGIPNSIRRLHNEGELIQSCTANLRGISNCYGALIFEDSPLTPGRFKTWNYTIRTGSPSYSGSSIFEHKGSEDTFWLPLQLAVDNAILNSTQSVNTYGFTQRDQATVDKLDRGLYLTIFLSFFLIVFFAALLPMIYHAVNAITTERAGGMSQLIDAMGGSAATRVAASCIYLNIIYFPTWLVAGVEFWYFVFTESNPAILIFWCLLSGVAFTNASIFAAAFFSRRVVSSVVVCCAFIALGGVAAHQINKQIGNGAVIAFSLLFPAMNYVFALGRMIRFPIASLPIDMNTTSKPTAVFADLFSSLTILNETYPLPVSVFWVLLAVQIVVYPLLAVVAERVFHGISLKGRTLAKDGKLDSSTAAVETFGLRKVYPPSIWRKIFCCAGKSKNLTAVDGLDLVAHRNQVLCLLGVNGSGKTTTLDLIAGFQRSTAGQVRIGAASTQLGVCPQKNVLHPQLTVFEHVKFWSDIKGGKEDVESIHRLIQACDLAAKTSSRAGKLSGGQKRKLQLACMFVGGSLVCLMDEVTTGLDPLSRRVIWNIILAERSKRTMLFTTHFLDEGEVLADHIVLLSKGNIKAQGSGAEMKNQYGGGYLVHVPRDERVTDVGITPTVHQDRVVYNTPDTKSAGELIAKLEAAGHSEVALEGPTIEKVFLALTKDVDDSVERDAGPGHVPTLGQAEKPLASGRPTSTFHQIGVLFRKRVRTLPRFWVAPLLALFIPCFIPSQLQELLHNYKVPECDKVENGRMYSANLATLGAYSFNPMAIGPLAVNNSLSNVVNNYPLARYYQQFGDQNYNETFVFLNSFDSFQDYIASHTSDISSGLWMGDDSSPPTLAYMAEYGGYSDAVQAMNVYTNLRAGQPIGMSYGSVSFAQTFAGGDAGSFYALFAVFIFAAFPAFFALYPAFEKSHNIRQLQYANGIRPFPVWMAHLLFDFVAIVIIAVAFTATIANQFSAFWFAPGWIFLIALLYGLATLLITYLMARISRSQLSAFFSSFGAMILMYIVTVLAYMLPQSLVETEKLEQTTDAISFSLGLFLPTANLWKALEVGLNVYKVRCRNRELVTYPGSIYAYGGPVLLLLVQVLGLSLLLVWLESNRSFGALGAFIARRRAAFAGSKSKANNGTRSPSPSIAEEGRELKPAVAKEAARVHAAPTGANHDLLRLAGVSKSFGANTAVDDVSLGLREGEILALLGPNGAGKTTIANMIVGDLAPDAGTIMIRDIDVHKRTRAAQRALGVCPQFDALDLLTARQHLEFYGRIRGVPDVKGNVENIMRRLGLTPHADKLASRLSGGNKRKLSLGIALVGNPDVLVLDEPSSAMDAAAKRAMWRMLAAIAPGRSVLLTTHSMEEADALATRAAILAKRLLAIGTTQELRHRYSNLYHVTLVLKTAPESSADEMRNVEEWVRTRFADAGFEGESLGGQVRFVVPNASSSSTEGQTETQSNGSTESEHEIGNGNGNGVHVPSKKKGVSIADIIATLEAHKDEVGVSEYSIGAPTLERVFLSVVKDNYVEEEEKRRPWWRWWS